jgi:hypothetical protein
MRAVRFGVVISALLAFNNDVRSQDTVSADGRFNLEIPIKCKLNEDCWVVNYFDQDPSEKAADYRCGPISDNTHGGTDFAIPDLKVMREGVDIIASASGVVIGTRDGMRDVSVAEIGRESLKGNDCGNGVAIDHEGGWRTQYCHMREGSIAVKTGDKVETGSKLGLVGLSGNTVFPHLHLSVFKNGQKRDPFSVNGGVSCTADVKSLWSDKANDALIYQPAIPYIAGFAPERADTKKARAGQYSAQEFKADTPAITFWVDHFNLRQGDRFEMVLRGPNGAVIAETERVMEKKKALWFQFIGKRKPRNGWPIGTYQGTVRVYPFDKDEESVRTKSVTFSIVE